MTQSIMEFICNQTLLMKITHYMNKNPAYGRHQLSRPMRIVGPIQFWRFLLFNFFFHFFFWGGGPKFFLVGSIFLLEGGSNYVFFFLFGGSTNLFWWGPLFFGGWKSNIFQKTKKYKTKGISANLLESLFELDFHFYDIFRFCDISS